MKKVLFIALFLIAAPAHASTLTGIVVHVGVPVEYDCAGDDHLEIYDLTADAYVPGFTDSDENNCGNEVILDNAGSYEWGSGVWPDITTEFTFDAYNPPVYQRSPDILEIDSAVTFYVSVDDILAFGPDIQNGTTWWMTAYYNDFANNIKVTECMSLSDLEAEHTIDLPPGEYDGVYLGGSTLQNCEESVDNIDLMTNGYAYMEGPGTIFTVVDYGQGEGGGGADNPLNFFGTSTPIEAIFDPVKTGVQDTGGSVWPLFTVVGVPLTFVIGRRLLSLIKF